MRANAFAFDLVEEHGGVLTDGCHGMLLWSSRVGLVGVQREPSLTSDGLVPLRRAGNARLAQYTWLDTSSASMSRIGTM